MFAHELDDAIARLLAAAKAGHITRDEFDERSAQLLARHDATVRIHATHRTPYAQWHEQQLRQRRAAEARRHARRRQQP